jgi:DNA repair photolyase
MAIISASRRTDIPSFFPEWFMKRIRAGFFHRLNPFNARQVRRISLKPGDVDAIVFWTKNPQPLLKHLPELDQRGYRYYFQFTLNSYDNRFEPNLPPLAERIDIFRRLSSHVGPGRVIWRYDPIILSNVTPPEFHIESINHIAAALQGSTERLMFSFFSFYAKLKNRIRELEQRHGITIRDTSANHDQVAHELVRHISQVTTSYGMAALSCAEKRDLSDLGILHGSCIDGALIAELFGLLPPHFTCDRNQRGACRCVESIDMGMYDTCSFRCVYCYANRSGKGVEINLAKHDLESASIIRNVDEKGDCWK